MLLPPEVLSGVLVLTGALPDREVLTGAAPRYGTPSRGHYDRGGSYSHRPYGHRPPPRGYYPYRGHYRGYPGFGAFLPGLIVGGFLGWSLAPRSYVPGAGLLSFPTLLLRLPGIWYPPPGEGTQAPPAEGQCSSIPAKARTRINKRMTITSATTSRSTRPASIRRSLLRPAHPKRRRPKIAPDYLRALEACLDARGYTLR